MIVKRSLMVLFVVGLLILPLSACGGGNGGKSPVKIGALSDWTGSGAIPGAFYADHAIKLVEKQVKDMGGILDGREVKFKKYDGNSTGKGIFTAANKAVFADKASVLVWGGTSPVDGEVVSSFAEQNKVLFIDASVLPTDISNLKYTVRGGLRYDEMDVMAEYAVKALKAKSVAILSIDLAESHRVASRWEQIVKSSGAEVVYKDYTAADIIDFNPYITKIKYHDPDVLLTNLDMGSYALMVQQMSSKGGLGDTRVIAGMPATWQVKQPAIDGWYIFARWVSGMNSLASQKFEQDYVAMYGEEPDGTMEMMYDMLWMSIKAIEAAGTDKDRVAIATAARSGEFGFDTPLGYVTWGTDGEPVQRPGVLAHVEGGHLVPVQVEE